MEMLFGNKGIQRYIDAKVGSVAKIENSQEMFRVRMLTENGIPYLWKPTAMYVNGDLWLRHNTENYYVFERLLSQSKINGEMLKSVFCQLFECVQMLELYLLEASDLVINTDYMFWNPATQKFKFIYLPGHKKEIRLQLKEFLERVMKQFDHQDRAGVELLYESYGMVADEQGDIQALMRLVTRQAHTQQSDMAGEKDVVHLSTVSDIPVSVDIDTEELTKTRNSVWIPILMVMDFCGILGMLARYFLFHLGKSNLMVAGILGGIFLALNYSRTKRDEDESDDAMREYQMSQPVPYTDMSYASVKHTTTPSEYRLVPLTNGALEYLCVTREESPITVGRGKKDADYCVQASQISRVHASLSIKGDGLYIKDQNSTNGTFVNTNRLMANQEIMLKKGDVVAFANEEFYVS